MKVKILMECEKIMQEYNTNYLFDLMGENDSETGKNLLKVPAKVKQKAREGKYRVYCILKGIEYKEEEFLEADISEVEKEYATFRNKVFQY